jgi:hypothetical protein
MAMSGLATDYCLKILPKKGQNGDVRLGKQTTALKNPPEKGQNDDVTLGFEILPKKGQKDDVMLGNQLLPLNPLEKRPKWRCQAWQTNYYLEILMKKARMGMSGLANQLLP